MPPQLQQTIQSSSALGKRVKNNCDVTKSSMLEMGADGTLRYFIKSSSGNIFTGKEVWSVAGGKVACDSDARDGQCGAQEGASFLKDGELWYVIIDNTRYSVNRDAVRDFM